MFDSLRDVENQLELFNLICNNIPVIRDFSNNFFAFTAKKEVLSINEVLL